MRRLDNSKRNFKRRTSIMQRLRNLRQNLNFRTRLSEIDYVVFVNGLRVINPTISSKSLAISLDQYNYIRSLKISSLGHLRDLTVKDLQRVKLDKVTTLKLISVGFCGVVLLEFLRKAPETKELEIINCTNLQDLTVKDLQGVKLKKLEKFVIGGNSNISVKVWGELLKGSFEIQELEISFCQNFHALTAEDFQGIKLDKLTKLRLKVLGLNGKALLEFLRRSPEIKELEIMNCTNLQDLTVEDLQGIKLKKLEKFVIGGDSNISVKVWLELLKGSVEIKELAISYCRELKYLTAEDLQAIKLDKLTTLEVEGLSIRSVVAFLRNTSAIEVLVINDCDLKDLSIEDLQGLIFNKLKTFNVDNSNRIKEGLFFERLKPLNVGNSNRWDEGSIIINNRSKTFDFGNFYNIKTEVLAAIIIKSKLLHTDGALLLNCLQKFKEYHVSIGAIVDLITKNIEAGFNIHVEVLNKIFAKPIFSFTNKFKLMQAIFKSLDDIAIKEMLAQSHKYPALMDFIEAANAKRILFVNGNATTIAPIVRSAAVPTRILSFLYKDGEFNRESVAGKVYGKFENEASKFTCAPVPKPII